MFVKVFHNQFDYPDESLLNLVHESFRERLDANLNFGCATFTLDEFKSRTENAYIVVVFDDLNNIPIGTASLAIHKKGNFLYGIHKYLAISPNYKRKGIGKIVFDKIKEIACDLNLDFIFSTTSVDAESSVNWHLKNGFKKFRYISYRTTNYYSYFFIYKLKNNLFNSIISFFRFPIYICSYAYCKLFYDKNGNKIIL